MKTKRLAAIFLSLITAISLNTQVFADVVDPNAKADDGGTVAGASTLPGYDNTYDYGYRVSMVDESGKSLGAADLLDPRIYSITDNWGSSTGTDKSSSGQRVESRALPSDMPAPLSFTGSSFEGQGNAVKNYLTQKNGDGVENVVKIAQESFANGKDEKDELVKALQSGEKQLIVEPILSLPSYTDEPIGTTRTTSDGKQLHVVQVTNPASGRVYRYWANADGSEYTYTGTIREFVQEELGPYGSIKNNFVGGVIKQTLKSFMFNEEAFGLKSMSEDEIEDLIEKICEHPDLLDELAAGAFAFSNKQAPTTPPTPTTPTTTTSSGSINITESRITRSIKLSDVDNTLFNYQFTWEVPKFDESIKDHMYGYYAHSSGATITDKTNVVIVTEEKKPDDKTKGSGIIGNWTFPTHSDPFPEYRQTWSDRNWGDQSFSTVINLNPVEYRVTAVRQKSINDIISLISYRSNPNASAIIGATSTIVNGNKGDQRASNSGGSFAVDVEFKAGITDSTTVAIHSDKFKKWLYNSDGSPKLDNAGNHKWTTETKTKTDTKTTTVKSGADKLQMTLNVNWSTYSGTTNTTNANTAAGLTQHFKNGKQETWLEINYGTVSFYPYVRMQFDTVTQQGSQVYVAGKYPRSFTANEHVGVIFNTSKNTGHSIVNTQFGTKKGKISLQSSQWSTHATAIKQAGSNCVLPGGAVLDLAILKDDRQTFTVESIKPILAGSGLNQVNATKTNIIELQCVY